MSEADLSEASARRPESARHRLFTRAMVDAVSEDETTAAEETALLERFCMRECVHFAPSQRDKNVCECGMDSGTHAQAAADAPVPDGGWSPFSHTVARPSNAFGVIRFLGQELSRPTARFVRAAVDTNPAVLRDTLINLWNVPEPGMLLSITGGAQDFETRPRLERVIQDGLMRAAIETRAWIVTGGTDSGIMRHVGEAVARAPRKIPTIGIASWGCCTHNEKLVVDGPPQQRAPMQYRKEIDNGPTSAALDPNHNYFILVDDGSVGKWGREIPLRAKFESAVANPSLEWTWEELRHEWTSSLASRDPGAADESIPAVTVVVHGGPGTVDTVYSSVVHGAPVVAVAGSGGAADFVAFVWRHIHQNSPPENPDDAREHCSAHRVGQIDKVDSMGLCPIIVAKATELWPKLPRERIELSARAITAAVRDENRVVVFELRDDETEDISHSIFKAFLKSPGVSIERQMEYVVQWNQSELARREILAPSHKGNRLIQASNPEVLGSSLELAIKADCVQMVDLLLSFGADIAMVNLESVYDEVGAELPFLRGILRQKAVKMANAPRPSRRGLVRVNAASKPNDAQRVRHMIQDALRPQNMLGPSFQYAHEGPTTYFDILVFAALALRPDLAKLLWEKVEHPLESALMTAAILRGIARRVQSLDQEDRERMREAADEFDAMAVGVLDAMYEINDETTIQVVMGSIPSHWSAGASLIEVSIRGESSSFVAHRAVQAALQRRWLGDLDPSTSGYSIILALLLPVLVVVGFVRLSPPAGPAKEREGAIAKLRRFYAVPAAKFWLQALSYALFLVMYVYMVLRPFNPNSLHVSEILVVAYVGSFFVGELLQAWAQGIRGYTSEFWNIVDCLMILAYTAGFVLRVLQMSLDRPSLGEDARPVMGIAGIFFFTRFMDRFQVDPDLGPLLVMIGRMLTDLKLFVFIAIIALLGFGVAMYSTLFPSAPASVSTALTWIFNRAYWQAFGELFLEEFNGDVAVGSLNDTVGSNPALSTVLMGLYVVVANVLLVNLLIAMMADTYTAVRESSQMYWRVQRVQLIHEYEEMTAIPHPFSVLSVLVRMCSAGRRDKVGAAHDGLQTSANFRKLHRPLLKLGRDRFVEERAESVRDELGYRVSQAQTSVERVTVMLQEDRDSVDRQFEQLQHSIDTSVDAKLDSIMAALGVAPDSEKKPAPPAAAPPPGDKGPSPQAAVRKEHAAPASEAVCKIGDKDVPVIAGPGVSENQMRVAVANSNFQRWCSNIGDSLNVSRVLMQSVDLFGARAGFIKFKAEVTDARGQYVPGIVFMRGGAVAVLVVLECEGKRYTVLTVQARVPVGAAALAEIPAGMLDESGDFKGVAAKELEQETGIKISTSDPDFVDLTELAYGSEAPGVFPSVGGCDEFLRIFVYRTSVSREELTAMQGKLLGVPAEGESIALRVVPFENLWRFTPDAKALMAVYLLEQFEAGQFKKE